MMNRRQLLATGAAVALLAGLPVQAANVGTPFVLGSGNGGPGSTHLTVTTTADSPATSTDVIVYMMSSGVSNVFDSVSNSYTLLAQSYNSQNVGLGYSVGALDIPLGGGVSARALDTLGNIALIGVSIPGPVAFDQQNSATGTGTGPTPAALPQDAFSVSSAGSLSQANVVALAYTIVPTGTGYTEAVGFTTLASQDTLDGFTIRVSYTIPTTPAPIYFDPLFGSSVAWAAKLVIFDGPAPLPQAWLQPIPTIQTFSAIGINNRGGLPANITGLTVATPAIGAVAWLIKIGTANPTDLANALSQAKIAQAQGTSIILRIRNTLGASGQSGTSYPPITPSDFAAYAANVQTILTALRPYMGSTAIAQCEAELDNGNFSWLGPNAFTGSLSGNSGTVTSGSPPPVGAVICGSNITAQNVLTSGGGAFTFDGTAQTTGSIPMWWGTITQISSMTVASYLPMYQTFISVCHRNGVLATDSSITGLGILTAYWYYLRTQGRFADADFVFADTYSSRPSPWQFSLEVPTVARPDLPTFATQPQQLAKLYIPPLLWAGIGGLGADKVQFHWVAYNPYLYYAYATLQWAQSQVALPPMMEIWTVDATAASVQAAMFIAAAMKCTIATYFCSAVQSSGGTPLFDPTTGALNLYGMTLADVIAYRAAFPNTNVQNTLIPSIRARNIR